MSVVNKTWVLALSLCWVTVGPVKAVDDFDFDALFDMNGDPAPATPNSNGTEWFDEEAPAAPVENGDMADDEFGWMDDLSEEPVADEVPEPATDMPAAEEQRQDDNNFFGFDEPVTPAESPAEVVPAEPASENDVFFGFDPVDEEPTIVTPAVPAQDDMADDTFDFGFDVEEPAPAPAAQPAAAPAPAMDEDWVEEPVVATPRALSPVEAEARAIAAAEEVRRQAAEINGLQNLDAGFRHLDANESARARQAFEIALRNIPDRPATLELRERANWGLAEAHFRIATDIYNADGDLRVARQNLEQTQLLSPNHRGLTTLQRRLVREEARRLAEQARPIPVERREEIVEKREAIADLMQEGIALYNAGELNRAELVFDNVLVRDEYNTQAMRYLRRIAEDRMRLSTRMRETTTADMLAAVTAAWNPPRRDEVTLPGLETRTGPTDLVTPSTRLREKMEQIVIPRIEFRQANIADVVSFLRDASEAADPDGEGVNIILNLNLPEAPGVTPMATPAADPWGGAADDPWGAVAPAAQETASFSGVPNITLNLRRISLMEAIRYITEVAGLRYRIEDSAVVITPAGVADVGRVVTRLYPVQPSFFDVIGQREDAAPQQAGFGEFQAFGERRVQAGRPGDVKAFFEGAGVQFPVGTSITYNPTISQLIVANTPENLERFERILQQLNIVPNQVEIEARFVEVAEDDMRELGLQWLFTDNYEFLQREGSGPIGGRERVQIDSGEPTRGMRFFGTTESGISPVSSGLTTDPAFIGNILSISSILTNPELRVVLHALSQNGNVDVLSAPRVTTRSGVNATIEVVTEIIYPTEFRVSEPQFRGGESGVATPPTVNPEQFETRKTGVVLNVTPTVGPDGYTIDLSLVPEVSELVDWIQYGSRITLPNPADPDGGTEFVYNIPQPVFASRNVNTSIVIWDGQTVVMGGLMRERMIKINDKIPILGDIPILGRLFRSEGQRSRKENLMIFVTARLVDPAGKPIHAAGVMNMPGAGVPME